MKKILLVEDDASLGPALKKTLENNSYHADLATNLAEARTKNFTDYDLILLDWMLPDGQGIDLLQDIKGKRPVIMLTARTELIDKVLGLESGANDYMTKPFEPRELVARIRVQLRQPQSIEADGIQEFKTEHLYFNLSERKFKFKGEEVILTKMEYDLLYLLATTPNQIFSREKLLDKVWGYENYPTTRTVDTHVLQIRQKLNNDVIETVRGVGYRFNPDHD
ncbi:MAG: DNA-binding response regulator [Halobacteriovoraceae bacterium]|nr:DNA-binding response regulator [Halobacteriovoraceae bacterium]|tara:strand:+ start:14753 stop:15418 length:666 start_codon:yes stop_codon:yes gene_type:complete